MVHRKISPSAKVLLKIVLVAWKLLGSNLHLRALLKQDYLPLVPV